MFFEKFFFDFWGDFGFFFYMIAASADSNESKETNPNPLDAPVSPSRIIYIYVFIYFQNFNKKTNFFLLLEAERYCQTLKTFDVKLLHQHLYLNCQ